MGTAAVSSLMEAWAEELALRFVTRIWQGAVDDKLGRSWYGSSGVVKDTYTGGVYSGMGMGLHDDDCVARMRRKIEITKKNVLEFSNSL